MADLTRAEATSMLKAIGFDNAARAYRTAVRGFQRGWNLGPALKVDGIVGPLTSAALRTSYARHRKGLTTLSANFDYREFRCKCGGAFADCRRIWVLRKHVRRLEVYRGFLGQPVVIISGCRCPGRNRQVGGAASSQHMFGVASDVTGLVTLAERRRRKTFAGLGYKRGSTLVVHVDSRDLGGHNPHGATPKRPATWRYG